MQKRTARKRTARTTLERLVAGGVIVRCPASVDVGDEVRPERIAPGVVLHAGTRLRGEHTSIGPGGVIGAEAPATLEDCQLGHGVELKGGFFGGATFLDGVSLGSAAHVRPGTLLEEESGAGHAAGFKQTIFLPFVTAGSLVNFCDALMSGGTSRRDHSEIGSSYVHFNFTPNQDKATPSLAGDVPRGVLLDRPPIFLGGQGGLVGPTRIEFGTVVPAGRVIRQDVREAGTLHGAPSRLPEAPRPFVAGLYRSLDRTVTNNLVYIGNLHALRRWYRHARARFLSADPFRAACLEGAQRRLDEALRERRRRLEELVERMPRSLELSRAAGLAPDRIAAQQRWREQGPELIERAAAGPTDGAGAAAQERFLRAWERAPAEDGYLAAVRSLSAAARRDATAWLQAVVDTTVRPWSGANGA